MRFDRHKDPAALVVSSTKTRKNRYKPHGVGVVGYGGNVYLASTDGLAAILVQSVNEDGDSPTPMSVWPSKAFRGGRVALNGVASHEDDGVRVEYRPVDKEVFPPLEEVVSDLFRHPATPVESVILDASALAKIQKGLASGGVRLTFRGDSMPILVEPVFSPSAKGEKDSSFGVIMPMKD